MIHKNKIVTRFILNGFTINPVTEKQILINVMRGLGQYKKNHLCDYGKDVVHKNYLGGIVLGPFAAEVDDVKNAGLVGNCILDNGYYTVRIWNNIHPSRFQFDLFLEDDLKDLDLIIDHLSAPPIPNDGFGIFDYTYSLETEKIPDSFLFKNKHNDSSYQINNKINFLNKEKNEWEIVFNELKSVECHYCKENGTNWIFIDDVGKNHLNFKSVIVCKEHLDNGRIRELSSTLGNAEGKDFYTSKTDVMFLLKNVVDEDGTILYTKNFPFEREVNND